MLQNKSVRLVLSLTVEKVHAKLALEQPTAMEHNLLRLKLVHLEKSAQFLLRHPQMLFQVNIRREMYQMLLVITVDQVMFVLNQEQLDHFKYLAMRANL
jgi:hypothetical protein